MVFQQLSGGSRTADTHPAFAEAKVQHFVDIPVFFQNGVLADHADISSTILYIGGNVGTLCQEKRNLYSSLTKISFLVSLSFISSQVMPICSKSSSVFWQVCPFPEQT